MPACGYIEICKCCCKNGCCPQVCWFRGLLLTFLDQGNVCTTTIPLTWQPARPFLCPGVNVTGCWAADNQTIGSCRGEFSFEVACIDALGGGCILEMKATHHTFPVETVQCYDTTILSCNPLLARGFDGKDFVLGQPCQCQSQLPQGIFFLTAA